MNSTEVRTSRMPEIENIALREALKDFGLEGLGLGEDIVVHVERGPKGLFVSQADSISNARSVRETLEEIDALCEDVDVGFESFCRENPEKAIDLAIDSLERSARMMTEIVDETRRDRIEFEIRSKQIDRTQARTRAILDELIGETL